MKKIITKRKYTSAKNTEHLS